MSDEWELHHDHETSPSLEDLGIDDDPIDLDDPTTEPNPLPLPQQSDEETDFGGFDEP
jgi:hypothetical protein